MPTPITYRWLDDDKRMFLITVKDGWHWKDYLETNVIITDIIQNEGASEVCLFSWWLSRQVPDRSILMAYRQSKEVSPPSNLVLSVGIDRSPVLNAMLGVINKVMPLPNHLTLISVVSVDEAVYEAGKRGFTLSIEDITGGEAS